jgi:hypothetical protein
MSVSVMVLCYIRVAVCHANRCLDDAFWIYMGPTYHPVDVLSPRDFDGIAECGEMGRGCSVATSRIDARRPGSIRIETIGD